MVVALALLQLLLGWTTWRAESLRQRIPRAEKASACSVLMKKVVSPRVDKKNQCKQ